MLNPSIDQSITQSMINQSVDRSVNHSINQSIDQSITQSMQELYPISQSINISSELLNRPINLDSNMQRCDLYSIDRSLTKLNQSNQKSIDTDPGSRKAYQTHISLPNHLRSIIGRHLITIVVHLYEGSREGSVNLKTGLQHLLT